MHPPPLNPQRRSKKRGQSLFTGSLTYASRTFRPLRTRKPNRNMPPSRVPPYLGENWQKCRRRAWSVRRASLHLQLPLTPIPAGITGKVPPAGDERKQEIPASSATATKPSNVSQLLIVMATQDSTKHQVEKSFDSPHPKCTWKGKALARAPSRNQNEGVAPSTNTASHWRLSSFVEGWKHITNDPYSLSIVKQGYRLCFMSPPLLLSTTCGVFAPALVAKLFRPWCTNQC